MPTSPFRLNSTIGRSYQVDPNDTSNTKIALRELGYFETPSFGITPYPDSAMFQGIEEFQDDFDLRKDGLINPKGETEQKLNEIIDLKKTPLTPSVSSEHRMVMPQLSGSPKGNARVVTNTPTEKDRQQVAALPIIIPIIVYEVAIFFGMSLSAAYAWWISRSAEEKRKIREQIKTYMEEGHSESPSDAACEELLRIDSDTCRQLSKKRGKQAGARCYATAMDRYSACRKGRPLDELPPLDTWNN